MNFELKTRENFGKLCELHKKTGLVAEIGVQYGVFSAKIAENYSGKVLCIDLWGDETIYAEAKKLLANKEKFKLYRGDSLTIAEFIPDGALDAAYIDGNHYYREVLADIEAWYPKVRTGGILAGHDYCNSDADIEVIQAVDEWCLKTGYKIQVTTEDFFNEKPYPTWWIVKR